MRRHLGLAGSNAVCLCWPNKILLRAVARLSTRHRWTGHCQPLLDDRLGRHDARNEFWYGS